MEKGDIVELSEVKKLVDDFYFKVQHDEIIGGIFHSVIKDWTQHLEKMYRFWQTILLNEHTYTGVPFAPHAQMQIDSTHFDRWLQLWQETIYNSFDGPNAREALKRGEMMANIFLSKIQYLQSIQQ